MEVKAKMKKKIYPSDENIENRLNILKDVPERNLIAAAEARTNFLEQADKLRLEAARQAHAREQKKARTSTASTLFGRSGFFSLGRIVLLVLVLFFSGGAATVYASQGSLPGEGLYPVKVLSENTLLTFTTSPEKKLNLTLQFTDRRLDEITTLHNIGQPVPQQVIDLYNQELNQSLQIAAGMDVPAMLASLQEVSMHADEQLKAMQGLLNGKKSPQALLEIQKRLEEQKNEASQGQVDPQDFKRNHHDQDNNHGNPASSGTVAPTSAPDLTMPMPTETLLTGTSTEPGNQGHNKPTATPTLQPSPTIPTGTYYLGTPTATPTNGG